MRWLWGAAIGPGGDCGELDHMPARGGNGSREVFPCGDVGAFHPVSYAKIEVWILCDISQLKNIDFQFSFSASMKADRGHLGPHLAHRLFHRHLCVAHSVQPSSVWGSRWSALVDLLVATLIQSPELIIGFFAFSVSPPSQQPTMRWGGGRVRGLSWIPGTPGPMCIQVPFSPPLTKSCG